MGQGVVAVGLEFWAARGGNTEVVMCLGWRR